VLLTCLALLAPDRIEARPPATGALSTRLAPLLAGLPEQVNASVLVVDADSRKPLFALEPDRPTYPASVQKLFTTSAALLAFGPDHRFETTVRGGTPDGEGHVPLLVLVGSGDPGLHPSHLRDLARTLKDKGLRSVGELRADGSAFDEALPRGYEEKKTDAAYRAPISALTLGQGAVLISVKPGPRVGAAPEVVLDPACAYFRLDLDALTVAGKSNKISVSTRSDGGRTRVVVRGTIGLGAAPSIDKRAAWHPNRLAASVFAAALQAEGVRVTGKAGPGKLPDELAKRPPLATHRSAPLETLIATTNKTSSNPMAETLFKALGLHGGGPPATAEKSEKAVRKALAPLDLPLKGVVVGNGSGLYHSSKSTTRAIVGLLLAMRGRGAAGDALAASLAIAGTDGTLRKRLKSAPALGNVRAKTGTLDDVVALAGYAKTRGGHTLAFAVLLGGSGGQTQKLRSIQDRFVTGLCGLRSLKAVGSSKGG